jgi:hypothetical protein
MHVLWLLFKVKSIIVRPTCNLFAWLLSSCVGRCAAEHIMVAVLISKSIFLLLIPQQDPSLYIALDFPIPPDLRKTNLVATNHDFDSQASHVLWLASNL